MSKNKSANEIELFINKYDSDIVLFYEENDHLVKENEMIRAVNLSKEDFRTVCKSLKSVPTIGMINGNVSYGINIFKYIYENKSINKITIMDRKITVDTSNYYYDKNLFSYSFYQKYSFYLNKSKSLKLFGSLKNGYHKEYIKYRILGRKVD